MEIVDVCILLVRVGFRFYEFMDEFGSDSDTDYFLDVIRDNHVEAECGENDSVNNPCGIIPVKADYSDREVF